MYDWALHQQHPVEVVGREHLVDPLGVQRHPDRNGFGVAKELHLAVEHPDVGVAAQEGHLEREPIGVGEVIGVQACHQRSPAGVEAAVEGGDDPGCLQMDDVELAMSGRETVEDRAGLVGATVVYDDDLQWGEGLGECGVNRSFNRGSGVSNGHEERRLVRHRACYRPATGGDGPAT
jgi:hypothetical protein